MKFKVGDKIVLTRDQGMSAGAVGTVVELNTGKTCAQIAVRYDAQTFGSHFPFQDPEAMRKLTKLEKALK